MNGYTAYRFGIINMICIHSLTKHPWTMIRSEFPVRDNLILILLNSLEELAISIFPMTSNNNASVVRTIEIAMELTDSFNRQLTQIGNITTKVRRVKSRKGKEKEKNGRLKDKK